MNENERSMVECYVAFLDLMGVRKLAAKAVQDPVLCENIVSALKEAKSMSSFVHGTRDIETGDTNKWSLQVQAFSDCVVLFIPTETKMLSWLLASVRRLHDRLVRLNVPVRGGITLGDMHWDAAWDKENEGETEKTAPVAFGPGLISAYDLEDGTAVYPRILISEALYAHLDERKKKPKDKAFPLAMSGQLTEFIRQDFDGLRHLDVLHKGIKRQDVIGPERFTDEDGKHLVQNTRDKTTYAEWLEIVRKFIETGRAAVSGEKIEAKYMWLANYYNEKAKPEGGKLIRWFENLVPDGAIKLTEIQKSNDK